jgi:site-specific DNA recombinase
VSPLTDERPLEVVGYIRVSTAEQVKDGESLESQEARIRAWTVGAGAQVIELLRDEGKSGASLKKRPGALWAIELACERKAALVIYSLSRLSRSLKDLLAIGERLQAAGADLVSLTEKIDTTSAAGKMLFRVLAVLAEFERDLISERTRETMSNMRSRNLRIGEVPFGWNTGEDGRLTENVMEQAVIVQMTAWRYQGFSYDKIASLLTKQGVQTKKGNRKRWCLQSVRSVLEREALIWNAPRLVSIRRSSTVSAAGRSASGGSGSLGLTRPPS